MADLDESDKRGGGWSLLGADVGKMASKHGTPFVVLIMTVYFSQGFRSVAALSMQVGQPPAASRRVRAEALMVGKEVPAGKRACLPPSLRVLSGEGGAACGMAACVGGTGVEKAPELRARAGKGARR